MNRDFQPYPFTAVRHPATLPELSGGADRRGHCVAIVGGGIVGLTSALALASYGIRCVVLEADDGVCVGSRAICLSRRSLEILARFGALEPFLARSLPWSGGRSFYRNRQVLHFQMPHDADQRLAPMVNLQQFYIEQFLLDAALATGLVEVRWLNRVKSVLPCAESVALDIDTPQGSYRLETQWLLGCDGARSSVREAMNLKLTGTRYEGCYVIVDVRLRSERPTERLAWFDPPSNPGSTILMHRTPEDVWRIDYQLRDGEDPQQAVRAENVIPRIESHLRMIGEREDWSPIWISLYKANALNLAQYRQGRVLLAGDAAHLVPIFGVRGANSAFEDADNLAWKLALVIRGLAGESLLDSYSTERRYAAEENLRQGTKSTEFMSPPSFGFELMRSAVLGLAVEHAGVRALINPRQTQPVRYADSPLSVCGPGFAALTGPAPGDVLRECPATLFADDGPCLVHLTQMLQPGFTALYFTADGSVPASFRELECALGAAGVPFRLVPISQRPPAQPCSPIAWDHTGRLFRMYEATPGTSYLVRPDGHVLARWRRADAESIRETIGRTLHANGAADAEAVS